MLDQKPEGPSEEGREESLQDAVVSDRAADTGGGGGGGGGGGMLGRFRAGIAGQPGMESKPLWRLILVFVLKWGAIATAAFLVITPALVFAIGWTGPPPTFNMAGKAMEGIEVRRNWVALKDVSPHLVRAVIAAEDQNFCLHDGFDVRQIQKAIEEAERGRDLRGASTVSQQTAKNVFLFNGGGWVRKGFETYFTVLVEAMWSKPRTMEIYLNVAEWGDGIYGAERAAQERFGVPAKNLTSRQAALLAAVLPSPNRWKVTGAYANRRAGQIQTLMGVIRRDNLDVCVVKRR